MRTKFLFGVVASAMATGCVVPEGKYDEAVHTLRSEQAAHRDTAEKLYQIEQKLAYANGILEREHGKLSAQENELAQSKLDVDVAKTEGEDASRMVDQLRGELARVGDHLRAFSDQKSNLETALSEAESRAEALSRLEEDYAVKALILRDLTYRLYDDIGRGRAIVSMVDGQVRIRLDASQLFEGMSMRAEPSLVLGRIAKVVGPVVRARVEVTEHPSAGYRAEDAVVRLQSVADVLSEAGVPFERVTLDMPSEASAGEPSVASSSASAASGETAPESEDVTDAPPAISETPASPPEGASFMDGPGSVEIAIDLASPDQTTR